MKQKHFIEKSQYLFNEENITYIVRYGFWISSDTISACHWEPFNVVIDDEIKSCDKDPVLTGSHCKFN